jgi:hypothetical protein
LLSAPGDPFHVGENVRDLGLDRLERRLVEQVLDLTAVGDLFLALGARGQDDEVLADEARGAFADGRVVVEDVLGLHLDVDARSAVLERNLVDDAYLDTRDHDARARGDACDVR